jgi:ATP-dependent Clp protease ATP-binding subunit ClpC
MTGTKMMTSRACRVMALAEQEARRRGATAVEPEHVLLRLVMEEGGVAGHALRNLGASVECFARQLPAAVRAPASGKEPLPWAAATEQAVAQAHAELLPLGHNYVGTEHLVLGVLLTGLGLVPDILAGLGITAGDVRREVYKILGHGS